METNWISFSDAARMLATKFGDSEEAAAALHSKASVGGIVLRAENAAEVEKCGYLGDGGTVVSTHRDWAIPIDVWRGVVRPDALERRWRHSAFVSLSGGISDRRAIFLDGVIIDHAVISGLLAELPNVPLSIRGQMETGTGAFAPFRSAEVGPPASTLSFKMAPPTLAPAQSAARPSATSNKARVPEGRLKEWFMGFARDNDISAMSVDDQILPAAKAYFSNYAVARGRVRDLVSAIDPVRKQGPKVIRR
ncbi:hypothetical protein [Sphingobium cupriresistens]|uniref:Uncharacterized protein n=1 Tax=Sphingobium cupriresistens TaxID=1132417 RepID=A0A8G1ZH51_9SPHN|nr:hypothetical protein [Sphingobium cupriresistens]RYM11022.1 hypothetical protein EWH12_09965 [Sphingobium cupriresistens]